jgi:hypothetical protein
VRLNQIFYGIEAIFEAPTWGNFVGVHPIKNFCKEVENDLGFPFENQLMISVFPCEM